MTEYHLDPSLEEMANSIKGHADKFIRLTVQFGKKKQISYEVSGNKEDKVDKLIDIIKRGDCRIITQAIGTYTE